MIYKYKFFYFSKYSLLSGFDSFARRVGPLDVQTYEDWKNKEPRLSETAPAVENSEETPDPSRPWFEQKPNPEIPVITSPIEKSASFDEIIQLITTGQPVPGIRQIPDQLSTEPPSTSTSPAPPKKPWEK